MMSDEGLRKKINGHLSNMKVEEYGVVPKANTLDYIMQLIKSRDQQIALAAQEEWWICTDFFQNNGKKILGPFINKEIALEVRHLKEQTSSLTYAVDSIKQAQENQDV